MFTTTSTLIDALAHRVTTTPGQTALLFQDSPLTYADLWNGANAFAAALVRAGIGPGDRVIIGLPNGEGFLFAFWGAQRAGAVPVPAFTGSGAVRLTTIAGLCGARAIVVPPDYHDLESLESRAARLNLLVLAGANQRLEAASADFPSVPPDALALIQFTSGSTTDPRGVMLSHQNVLANIHQMVAASGVTEQDVFVNWLPLYHDLGLIAMTLVPLCLGASLILLESDFNVRRWLGAMARYRGTVTASPDLGYRLCIRNIKNPDEYDLSSLRLAVNAGEPVRARTIDQFERKFGLRSVMKPAYGLAEAAAGVTLWPAGVPVKVDQSGFVSVGRPLPGVGIQIVRDDQPAPDGTSGEIAVRGQNMTAGYVHNDGATAALAWQDGYILTGDLGFRDFEGDLYVIGRKKNIIITSGRVIAPQELEELVDDLPGVRCSAVIGIEGTDAEQVIVFAEVRLNEANLEQEGADTTRSIVRGIFDALGFRPERVILVRPHTIPMTTNGKVQHAALRDSYLNGQLKTLYPRS